MIGWGIERGGRAGQHGDQHNLLHGNAVQMRQHSQQHRQKHHGGLGDHQQPAPRGAVGDHAAQEREHQRGHLLRESHQAQPKGRVGELQHQPSLGHVLHPRADIRDEITRPEQPELRVPQRAEPSVPRREQ